METKPVVEEQVDVVIVGARPGGASTATALARAGRRVVVVDRAKFPSDTLSTHLLFQGCVLEIDRLGALDRVLATGAPKLPYTQLSGVGIDVRGRYTPAGDIDYGLCVRRPGLDMALLDTAREAGAEVREQTSYERLLWAGGRAAGIETTDRDGNRRRIWAKLVVGADGRRSSVAEALGVDEPYRREPNGRGLVFLYLDDPRGPEERNAVIQWRAGDTLGMYFPTDGDGGLALFMPPRDDIALFRRDPEGMWERKLAENPNLKARMEGLTVRGKQRSTGDTENYFRISSGPGWALVGDAGHFKDPVVAQGIRDALRFGRLLGEAAADALDDPAWLDRRLRAWEQRRDAETLPSFYLGRKHTRTHVLSAVEIEAYRDLAANQGLADQLADVFARTRDPQQLFSLPRQIKWTLRALSRPGADRGAIVRFAAEELWLDAQLQADLWQVRRGRRARQGRWSRWGRAGWAPSQTLGAPQGVAPPAARPALVEAEAEAVAA